MALVSATTALADERSTCTRRRSVGKGSADSTDIGTNTPLVGAAREEGLSGDGETDATVEDPSRILGGVEGGAGPPPDEDAAEADKVSSAGDIWH